MKGKYYNNFLHEQSINCIRLGLQWDNKHSKVSLQIFLLSKGKYNSITLKFALFTDLGSPIGNFDCGYSTVWTLIHFAATDFIWNQFWLISEDQKLPFLQFCKFWIYIFGKMSHLKMLKFPKNSKFRATQMVKMAVFGATKWSDLISRKIWVAAKSINFW